MFLCSCFGLGPATRLCQVNANSHFSVEKAICATGHISGRYTVCGLLKRGTGIGKGYPDISSSEPCVFDKCTEINSPAMSEFAIFGHGSQLSRHTRMHPIVQSIHLQMDNIVTLSSLVKIGGTYS